MEAIPEEELESVAGQSVGTAINPRFLWRIWLKLVILEPVFMLGLKSGGGGAKPLILADFWQISAAFGEFNWLFPQTTL